MIKIIKIKDGFRCDMCFQKTYFEIIADDRYNELPAFTLNLCKAHAMQLSNYISDAIKADENDFPNCGAKKDEVAEVKGGMSE